MKNRYCRRTKLSEKEFLHILSCFCVGLTATEAHALSADCNVKISRQTIAKKYLDLGIYFYKKWAKPALIKMLRTVKANASLSDEYLETAMLEVLWLDMRGELDYAEYRKKHARYPGPPELIEALKKRWKTLNGFQKDTRKSHLGIACFTIFPVYQEDDLEAYAWVMHELTLDPL